ncbi:sugar phosphate isomerase/epimerase family protein [Neorhizobium sp. T25_13]|uniref:sugar phosphate isomerase/epimerase family protein n=1 Tax=Neorhizobium sp. T25_13 TaxID=2093830 RepID=UPI00352B8C42
MFRHHLISIPELTTWAKANGFQAIELWGPHAQRLAPSTDLNGEWLRNQGLSISMLSDYLPLSAQSDELRQKTIELCRLAQRWQTKKPRTFAGNRASSEMGSENRLAIFAGVREACTIAADLGVRLLVETHPARSPTQSRRRCSSLRR